MLNYSFFKKKVLKNLTYVRKLTVRQQMRQQYYVVRTFHNLPLFKNEKKAESHSL
jgi:hypothetical protein